VYVVYYNIIQSQVTRARHMRHNTGDSKVQVYRVLGVQGFRSIQRYKNSEVQDHSHVHITGAGEKVDKQSVSHK